MTARAARKRRRRRLAIGISFALLLAVLTVVGVSRQQALEAARRAEASKLLALGQLELELDSSAALAYATKSLELADSAETRLFAMRALSNGPPVTVVAHPELGDTKSRAQFSPDGRWMALEGAVELAVVSSDGGTTRHLGEFPSTAGLVSSRFSPAGDKLFATKGGELRVWSVPDFEVLHQQQIPVPDGALTAELQGTATGYLVLSLEPSGSAPDGGRASVITPLSADGTPGNMRRFVAADFGLDVDWRGERFGYAGGSEVLVLSLLDPSASPQLVTRHPEDIAHVRIHPDDRRIASVDRGGQITISHLEAPDDETTRTLVGSRGRGLEFDLGGDQLVSFGQVPEGYLAEVWDLRQPAEARPLTILSSGPVHDESPAFSPDGRWLTTNYRVGRALWPVPRRRSVVLAIPGVEGSIDRDIAFTADGRLVSTARSELREWNLGPGEQSRVLASNRRDLRRLAVDQEARFVVASAGNKVLVAPFDDTPLQIFEGTQLTWPVAVDSLGRRAAAASMRGPAEVKVIRIWDLSTGEMRTLGPVEGAGGGMTGAQGDFEFLPDGKFISVGDGGLRLWDIEAGTSEVLAPCVEFSKLALFGGSRWAAYSQWDPQTSGAYVAAITDLDTRETRLLPSHGTAAFTLAVDPAGEIIASGSEDGTVRVGPTTGEEPHLLLGHTGMVKSVVISPDGEWIASIANDDTIRLWPMPDLSQPPLHALPYEQLLTRLSSLTNLRVVADEDASTGWRIDVGAFPGWDAALTW